MALLIADATPAFRTGTDDISVDVSGATTSDSPTPNSTMNGRTSTSTEPGGAIVAGSSNASRHGSEVAGIRANQARPAAMSSGPATRNGRAPYRPASAPTRVDSTVSRIPVGSPTTPAAVAEYPSTPWRNSPWNVNTVYRAP